MRTGATGYKFYQDVLAHLLGSAFIWLFGALFVRGAARLFEEPQPRSQPNNQFCRVCGYDLRATPDRCPECGSVPEKVIG